MIVLKRRLFSFGKNMTDKLIERLDRDRIEDYDVDDRVPTDVISVTSDPTQLSIYIPTDYEYSQYDIDDFIRSMAPHLRTTTRMDRNIYVMKLSGSLTFEQFVKLVKYIIKTDDFCTIIDKD